MIRKRWIVTIVGNWSERRTRVSFLTFRRKKQAQAWVDDHPATGDVHWEVEPR